ncbi:MAG: BON domain-containing protein [Deltaproteobacteria bacterium]|jgi:hyperosmotically inducible periplasmic protein|nr:BON domain-containing protein [Deltaproteobacteria bacterium]
MTVKQIVTGVIAFAVAGALSFATARAQQASPPIPPNAVTNSSTILEKENVHTEDVHHYQNPAEEAEDAALITKVKTALATDGVANGHPVEVDCDRGVARLSGVVDSADDAKHAAQVTAAVPGITGVDNKLTWR